ncbi:MAG TPA: undecaprenyl-diphosphate phosphatase [Gallionellaceae bacterium]|nr:undecaprenyl-diphosphate phosphatase [Gallionellaceae bacterium]
MDLILLLKAAILGVVEGFTEFLPISSTGHLIVAGSLLNFNDERGKLFEIVIQSAAIAAVMWEYRAKLLEILTNLFAQDDTFPVERQVKGKWIALDISRRKSARRFVFNVFIAFLPLAILGLLFGKHIKAALFNPITVAITSIVGAIFILWAEKRQHVVSVETADDLSWKDALKVGFAQALALIPGTSRSGATIIGGLFFGLSRKAATEFTFFLAMPTLIGATLYELYKERALLNSADLDMWIVGAVSSFVAAFLCVRWLLRYISSHDFTIFAWYRIAFGLIVLGTYYSGLVEWSIT